MLLPLYMLTTGLFAVGVGWIVASLHVFLRDTAQVLSVILTFWFWATPIFIEEGKFPKSARFLLHANPMYYAVRSLPGHSAAFHDAAVSRTWRFRRPLESRSLWLEACSSAT